MKPILLPIAELKPALLGLGKVIPRRISLPVLSAVKIDRTKDGWITLTGTDLDHFATVRLEQPAAGDPVSLLVPIEELAKLTKSCGKTDTISVWTESSATEVGGVLAYPIGQQLVERRYATQAVEEFPAIPIVSGESVALPEPVRASLQEAMACASTDQTRYILNGAYLDVSKPDGHYVVATDGRSLFSSNSFKLNLRESLIVPSHRFLDWKEFNQDGEWLLTKGPQPKDDPGWLRIDSRRWTFIGRQIEGNYPNWRQVVPSADTFNTSLEIVNVEEALQTVHRLPCHDERHHAIGIEVKNRKVALLGKSPGAESWTRVEIEATKVTGKDVLLALDREYLARALSFGLTKFQTIDERGPVRFSFEGRQMIVMPVRPDCGPTHQSATAPSGAKSEHSAAKPEPSPTTQTPASPAPVPPKVAGDQTENSQGGAEPPPIFATAVLKVEQIKCCYREAVRGLKGLADTVRTVQREQKASEKEVGAVRSTLEQLQRVRL